jgi:hypothetical protein
MAFMFLLSKICLPSILLIVLILSKFRYSTLFTCQT